MVKCADCGFLAVRDPITQQPQLADVTFREEGKWLAAGRVGWTRPLCHVLAARLETEADALDKELPRVVYQQDSFGEITNQSEINTRAQQPNLLTITKERPCTKFTQLVPWFTPKEHYEMLDRDRVIREQNRMHLFQLGIALLAVVVAVLGIGISAYFNLQAAYIQRSGQPTINYYNTVPPTITIDNTPMPLAPDTSYSPN